MADAHVSAFWDRLADATRDIRDVINPNRELDRFVTRALSNDLPVVCLGDAVDYALDDYDGTGAVDNRALFYGAVAPIEERLSEIPGNHDHRSGAYNLRAWGLDHVNMDRATFTALASNPGHTRIRAPWRELAAIRPSRGKGGALGSFRGERHPALRRIGGFDCLLLNTHGDGFFNPAGLARIGWRVVTQRLAGKRPDLAIDSFGLRAADLAAMERLAPLDGEGALLMLLHAPLVASRQRLNHPVRLDPARFERQRRQFGLDHHVIAHGAGALLDWLRTRALGAGKTAPRSLALLAGHTHTARYHLIDAGSLTLREVALHEFNAAWNDPSQIKMATVLPLGVIDSHDEAPRLGWAEIRADGLREVVSRAFVRQGARFAEIAANAGAQQ